MLLGLVSIREVIMSNLYVICMPLARCFSLSKSKYMMSTGSYRFENMLTDFLNKVSDESAYAEHWL